MRILVICSRLPFPFTTNAFSFRTLYGIRYLTEKYGHHVTIVALKYAGDSEEYLKRYCNEIITVTLSKSPIRRAIYYLSNLASSIISDTIFVRSVFDHKFSSKLCAITHKLVKEWQFDVIYSDHPSMLPYALGVTIPKVLEVWGATPRKLGDVKRTKALFWRIYHLLTYLTMRGYEKKYKKFDMCVTVTEEEKDVIHSYLPDVNIVVIPIGVDTEHEPEDFEEDFPSLIFFGNMKDVNNQHSITYFYDQVYPFINREIPGVKLYIVGDEPSKEIIRLARDTSVIVTGYVKDIRPYLGRASVVVLPVHGVGMKTRVLEAMVMGKPIVTSPGAVHGIDVTAGENIFIADGREEFAEKVVKLLRDDDLKKRVGRKARRLMVEQYSWRKATAMLNELFEKVASERKNDKSNQNK